MSICNLNRVSTGLDDDVRSLKNNAADISAGNYSISVNDGTAGVYIVNSIGRSVLNLTTKVLAEPTF